MKRTHAQYKALNFRPPISQCIKNLQWIDGCKQCVVYLWLADGDGFWYLIQSVTSKYLDGYQIQNNQLIPKRVWKKDILRYY